jgi:DNA-binding transcriptional LysR family regulator
MPINPRVGLDEWRALIAVVEAGGYAQAGARLHKSQSAISYQVQKLEATLGVKAFEIQGRKAHLTDVGQALYRRARALLEEAQSLELAARSLSAGWEAEIRLAVEVIFPTWVLLRALDRFGAESPSTRIELFESVIGGTSEALLEGRADLAILPLVPAGFVGEALMRLRFVPVAHPAHALHRLGRPLTLRDLRAHRHLVVRDTGSKRDTRSLWLEAKQRWTVSHMATSIEAVRSGYGFAWFAEERIRAELAAGTLKVLALAEGRERFVELYLVFADRDAAGPGTLRLAELIRTTVAEACAQQEPPARAAEPTPQARPASRTATTRPRRR